MLRGKQLPNKKSGKKKIEREINTFISSNDKRKKSTLFYRN